MLKKSVVIHVQCEGLRDVARGLARVSEDVRVCVCVFVRLRVLDPKHRQSALTLLTFHYVTEQRPFDPVATQFIVHREDCAGTRCKTKTSALLSRQSGGGGQPSMFPLSYAVATTTTLITVTEARGLALSHA